MTNIMIVVPKYKFCGPVLANDKEPRAPLRLVTTAGASTFILRRWLAEGEPLRTRRVRCSWYVIRARESSLGFQATDLSGVLACELQPDAGTHPLAFRNNNRAECLQS